MPYNRNIPPRGGMLQSAHASHLRPIARSSGSTFNPAAGDFKPQAHSITSHTSTALTHENVETMAAVVPHHHQENGNQQITVFASDLHELTNFFNEEILSLREDMEMIKQGGWSVTVGAFQPSKKFDVTEVNATRQRLQKSSGFLGALMAKSSVNAVKQVEGPPSPPNTPNRNGSGPSTAPAVQPPNGVFGAKPDGFLDSKDDTNDSDPKSPPVHPDTPIPSTEDPSFVHMSSAGNWQPLAIRNLRPLDDAITSTIPSPSTMQTFSWDFIRKFLLGKIWSPGFYYHPVAEGVSIVPSRTYYLLDASTDPYVPRSPAAHGAKLTAFFNPENPEDVDGDEAAAAFDDVPMFVAASDWAKRHKLESDGDEVGCRNKYLYMGMYSQLRFSDKLDYDRQVEQVPDAVKMYWAEQLADVARPGWVTDALMKAFVPKPEYEGHLPGLQGAEDDVVRQEIGRHVRDLREWEELARKKVGKLTKEKVLQAFAKEDAADPPGLRLWWEYLQCTGWDRGFYDMLVREQQKWVEKEKRVVKSMA